MPRSIAFGLIRKKSDENSTLPAALRGALSRSVTMRFAGSVGSTAKKIFAGELLVGAGGAEGLPAREIAARLHLDPHDVGGQRRGDNEHQERRSRSGGQR